MQCGPMAHISRFLQLEASQPLSLSMLGSWFRWVKNGSEAKYFRWTSFDKWMATFFYQEKRNGRNELSRII